MKLIGLTGLIGSGKSVFTDFVKNLGYKVVDADEISRNITKTGNEGYVALKKEFPQCFINNDLDRNKLKNIVFSNKEKLKKLNSILHPIIFKKIYEEIDNFKSEKIVFLDAPLLFETPLYKKCNEIVFISIRKDLEIKRIVKRDNVDESVALKIINSQMDPDFKIKNSNYIISNNGTIDEFNDKIKIILNLINR